MKEVLYLSNDDIEYCRSKGYFVHPRKGGTPAVSVGDTVEIKTFRGELSLTVKVICNKHRTFCGGVKNYFAVLEQNKF